MIIKDLVSNGETETLNLAKEFAAQIKRGDFIAIYGDLGAGKTAFTRGLCQVLTPGVRVSSPTYTVVNEYEGDTCTVCHFDMYRLESEDDLYSIGFWDYDKESIMVIEWPEKTPWCLPNEYYKVEIIKEDDTKRRIIISKEQSN